MNFSRPRSSDYNESDAKYPSYIAFTRRYQSFNDWPHQHALQSSKNMALSGFFYTGSSDRARCFYCGLTLRDWDEDDDPFTSHKQWSPHCAYISTIADQQLNSGLQQLHIADSSTAPAQRYGSASNHRITSDSMTCSDARSIPDNNEMYGAATIVDGPDEGIGLENTMSGVWTHPAHVEAVLEMGYSLDDIQKTMERRRLSGKSELTDACSLLSAIEGWD